jgi:hypothetical protein
LKIKEAFLIKILRKYYFLTNITFEIKTIYAFYMIFHHQQKNEEEKIAISIDSLQLATYKSEASKE